MLEVGEVIKSFAQFEFTKIIEKELLQMVNAINPSESVPTVKIKDGDDGYKIINREDFDQDEHKIFDESGKDPASVQGASAVGRNASGTKSEPTPTDIRYPNKDATEFENNHGAFIGQSAAELREALDMEDAPGGILPEVHEAVKEGEEAQRAALEEAAAPTKRSLKRALTRGKLSVDDEDEEEDTSSKKSKKRSTTTKAKKSKAKKSKSKVKDEDEDKKGDEVEA